MTGSYICECQQGFSHTSDGGYCIDDNECANNDVTCGENGRCVNTEGSYRLIYLTYFIISVGINLSSSKIMKNSLQQKQHIFCIAGVFATLGSKLVWTRKIVWILMNAVTG